MRFFPDQESWPVNSALLAISAILYPLPANEDAGPEDNRASESAGFSSTPSC